MPEAASNSGPRLGNRPEMDGEALTTATTSAATRASAVTRSRSTSSRITMSPGPTLESSRLVFLSILAIPLIPGRVSVVRDSRAGIFMRETLNHHSTVLAEARRNTRHFCHTSNNSVIPRMPSSPARQCPEVPRHEPARCPSHRGRQACVPVRRCVRRGRAPRPSL